MRTSCIECVLKHLGQATVLMHETVKGYPFYHVYVVGHLCEAEDEASDFPALRDKIVALRRQYQNGEDVDIDDLITEIWEMIKNGESESEIKKE